MLEENHIHPTSSFFFLLFYPSVFSTPFLLLFSYFFPSSHPSLLFLSLQLCSHFFSSLFPFIYFIYFILSFLSFVFPFHSSSFSFPLLIILHSPPILYVPSYFISLSLLYSHSRFNVPSFVTCGHFFHLTSLPLFYFFFFFLFSTQYSSFYPVNPHSFVLFNWTNTPLFLLSLPNSLISSHFLLSFCPFLLLILLFFSCLLFHSPSLRFINIPLFTLHIQVTSAYFPSSHFLSFFSSVLLILLFLS